MHLIVPSVMLHIRQIPVCIRGIPEALIYWESVPIKARVCIALYKLVHGCTTLDVFEKFTIGCPLQD